jgi:hypothetical protein
LEGHVDRRPSFDDATRRDELWSDDSGSTLGADNDRRGIGIVVRFG